MRFPLFLVDAFANTIGHGNPAGVVILNSIDEIADEVMKVIAKEVGRSETAFVSKENTGYSIRWFTPNKEMPLCGHATLAASKVLTDIYGKQSPLLFYYAEGEMAVEKDSEDFYEMTFPADNYTVIEADPVFKDIFGEISIIDCIYGERTRKTVLIVDENTDLKAIQPNYDLMIKSKGTFTFGIGISKKGANYDIESRYFNPWADANEDPVTGSVHTLLGKYWCDKLGKTEIKALQDSQRPGILALKIEEQKIKIGGRAVIVIEGNITI
jgi:PhzF family phenazine biosynthesis protein